MAATVYYRQCRMQEVREDGKTVIYTAWIPEKLAIVGRNVEIDHSKTESRTYNIQSVSIQRMLREGLPDVHNLKKQFPSIDR